jgi:spore germination cell wall hydrolase CwlJ-like protein
MAKIKRPALKKKKRPNKAYVLFLFFVLQIKKLVRFIVLQVKRLAGLISVINTSIKGARHRLVIILAMAAFISAALILTIIILLSGSPATLTVQNNNLIAATSDSGIEKTAVPTTIPTTTPIKTTEPESAPSPASKPTAKPTSTPKPAATPSPTPKPTATSESLSLNELSKYFIVETDKYYSDYGYSSNSYNYTEDEVTMLARVIKREVGGSTYEAQLAVGNVVMNRVLCGYWGSTIESVVTAPHQFAYKPATIPGQSCLNAALEVLKYERWVIPQNIYFFNSSHPAGENWGSHVFYAKIGSETFYSETIGKRYNGETVPPALFDRVYKWPQYGCKPGNRVSRIQHMLIALGYSVDQDGYFGGTTKEQLIKFQQDKGITADGVAGSSTIKALIKAYGKDKYISEYY